MPDFDTARFTAPTPGMSLTTEPGARPWEIPSKFSEPEDALNFYIDEFNSPKKMDNLFDILENNVPVTAVIDSLIITGVMQGVHSLDVATLIAPALYEFVIGIADISDIEYRTGIDEPAEESTALISSAIKEAKAGSVEQSDEQSDELLDIADEGLREIQKGLMLRPEPEEAMTDVEVEEGGVV